MQAVSALAIPNTPENWLQTYKTDLEAVVNIVSLTLPYLLKSTKSPNIITISSISGKELDFTTPGPYGPFKAALIHYSQSLAKELAPKGVRVNIVSPGNIYIEDGVWGNIEKGNPELFEKAMALNPMGRMGKAKEVADSVVFLASGLSGFTSGCNLSVDGAACVGVHI
jgi:NAD(P)-dependent dehydrogenase (short-subunit alcohol dehydrogenase family)